MKKAFTLAEVLITLTIIGVIAALTIPNLMKKWEDSYTVVAVKEAYSILDNAMKTMMRTEQYDSLMYLKWENDGWINYSSHPLVDLKPYLKISKSCSGEKGCYDPSTLKTLNGYKEGWGVNTSGQSQIVLANGMFLSIDGPSHNPLVDKSAGTVTGDIRVDINGKKGPNRYGYDVFFFRFNQNGMTPASGGGYSTYCRLNGDASRTDGYSCAYWILRHGNMDYKYRDVSAEW